MDEDEFTYWIELPAGTKQVVFENLPHLIALALWPAAEEESDARDFGYAGARINLEKGLPRAVEDGLLKVRDPLTFGPQTGALRRAVVSLPDLRSFLAHWGGGIGVRVASLGRAAELSASASQRPMQAQAAQEAAILSNLVAMSYAPLALPRTESGHPGVKALVRAYIGKTPLFHSQTVFDKAWQRLRDAALLAEK